MNTFSFLPAVCIPPFRPPELDKQDQKEKRKKRIRSPIQRIGVRVRCSSFLHILLSIPILQNHRTRSVFCCSGHSGSQPDLHRPTYVLFVLWNEYRGGVKSQANQGMLHTRGEGQSQRGKGWGAQTRLE